MLNAIQPVIDFFSSTLLTAPATVIDVWEARTCNLLILAGMVCQVRQGAQPGIVLLRPDMVIMIVVRTEATLNLLLFLLLPVGETSTPIEQFYFASWLFYGLYVGVADAAVM